MAMSAELEQTDEPAGSEVAALRSEAARYRKRARRQQARAEDAEDQLDALLDLLADRIVDQLRDRGWVEFHTQRPHNSARATENP